jgi:coproporphyrinogen III oxidase
MTERISVAEIKEFMLSLQDQFCQALEQADGSVSFKEDSWERSNGGGGRTRALEEGRVIEKCGVNFSHVWGDQLPFSANHERSELSDCRFQALGVSLIVHPRNPFAPTTHFNIRFFLAERADGTQTWWFGGGFDLTPYYGFEEDCRHWHQTCKTLCDPYGDQVYENYKRWADEYFFLKHRQEPRGIGGIFFDNLNEWGFDRCYAFAKDVGAYFLPAYLPILERRKDNPFSDQQRSFQAYRRGRYVEFNLVYDRGTLFGLQFGGRIESILISLPPQVIWRYDWQPKPESEEARLYQEFLIPRQWV